MQQETHAADDVQPTPTGESMGAAEARVNGRLEIPSEGGSHGRRHVEDGHSLGELRLGVPAAQDVEQDGEEGAFEETHEEPERVELSNTVRSGLREGEDSLRQQSQSS